MTISDNNCADAPSTVLDAVHIASAKSRNLLFLPSSYDSAEICPFQRPAKILAALCDLDSSVSTWQKLRSTGKPGSNIVNIMKARGWFKRCSTHISPTALGHFRRYYEFIYNGEKRIFSSHITIGSFGANTCASIHFLFDHEIEKVVIAHVGKHLPNTRS